MCYVCALILCLQYFEHVEEIEMAIEVCKKTGLPVVATMCIGPEGDMHGISTGDCAVRMVKAGADVVGINCHFDPFVVLEAVQLMINAVRAAGLKAHFITQPLAYHTPDAGKQGFIDLPEFPFGEACTCTHLWRPFRRHFVVHQTECQRMASRAYWENLRPSTGRPFSSAFSQPDNWGVTAGNEELKQQKEATSTEEIKKLQNLKK
ncbi:hypothetical protein HPB51_010121 [Rhipicephalus microplus]|uniref:Hcy-binding domain-containing protein n=1 Tax=Rhipicephalus microplus TaxID=6941 RepID=A0A9J6F1Y9_RHIMP|nr:hypothetical protein HPB51_010121 [Rhipicephalus microplus]